MWDIISAHAIPEIHEFVIVLTLSARPQYENKIILFHLSNRYPF
jgi:hypothetical protein